jgi:hypothetical protein
VLGCSPATVSRDVKQAGGERKRPGPAAKYPDPGERECVVCGDSLPRRSPSQAQADRPTCGKKDCRDFVLATGPRARKYPPAEPRDCEECGETFTPPEAWYLERDGERGRYCKRECYDDARRKYPVPEPRPCSTCGEDFTPNATNLAHGFGIYCSRECDADARAKYPRVGEIECARRGCAERFTPGPWEAAHGRRFCSPRCSGLDRWRVGADYLESLLVSPRMRQRYLGRWGGIKGASDGIAGAARGHEGGRERLATEEQVGRVWNLWGEKKTSRQIADEVFGDPGLKDRVLRILKSDD